MPERLPCEFFLLRYVPDPVKEEFMNIGLVLICGSTQSDVTPSDAFVDVHFTRDWRRVLRLAPNADIEMLEALAKEIRERLAKAGADRERMLSILRDSFSNTVQVSPPKACLAESPREEAARLAQMYLENS